MAVFQRKDGQNQQFPHLRTVAAQTKKVSVEEKVLTRTNLVLPRATYCTVCPKKYLTIYNAMSEGFEWYQIVPK